MSSTSAWTGRPAASPYGGERSARTRFAPEDFVTLLWRERRLMLAIFFAISLVGIAFALTMKPTYTANSSVLVRLGQEYVYEPRVGDAGRGVAPESDRVIQSEAEILGSDALRLRTLETVGYPRVFPKKADAWAKASPAARRQMLAEGVAGMAKAVKVGTGPQTSVIRVSYEHDDPVVSALVLNTLIQEYLVYRKQVLLDGAGPVTFAQQQTFQNKLSAADTALQSFLAEHGIGDFESQKTSLNTLQTSLTDESFRVQARLQEVQGRLGELARQATAVPAEIGLYRDNSAATNDKLLQLKLDREDLLSRYKPDAQPVRDVNQKIAQLEKMIADGRGTSVGASRTGPNPVFQTMQTERIQLSAEAASLRERAAALSGQIAQVTSQRLGLSALEPRYQDLLRERDVLAANVKDLTTKVEADAAAKAIAQASNDNIRVVEKAVVPVKGKSLRKAVAILAVLFAGFTALCAGLLKVLLTPGVPTPSAAERTFELPVLATAGLKTARA
jgi:uncharacterized protein involved in exopolysaccharide biosynthesis